MNSRSASGVVLLITAAVSLALAVLYVALSDVWAALAPTSVRYNPLVFAALIALRGLVELVPLRRPRSPVMSGSSSA